jgi:hypothetical protein
MCTNPCIPIAQEETISKSCMIMEIKRKEKWPKI